MDVKKGNSGGYQRRDFASDSKNLMYSTKNTAKNFIVGGHTLRF
jgi:hypothetical protein